MMTELTTLVGVGSSVAKSLNEQGIETVEDLANADTDSVEVPTGNVSKLISRANQETISSKSMADLLDEYSDQSFYPTGIDPLDESLGGGWESQTIGCIYGKSGKGKTQLTFSSMAETASEGSVVYLQTENQSKSIAERISSMAVDTENLANIHFYEAYSVDKQYETYEAIVDNVDVDLLVVDSFTAQFRVSGDFDGRENLSERSKVMGEHLKRLGEISREEDCAIILVGQVYTSPEAYSRESMWGGDKMEHFISHFVRMSSGKGNLVQAEVENHPGLAENTIDILIDDTGLHSPQ